MIDTNFLNDFLESSSYSYFKKEVENAKNYLSFNELNNLIDELQETRELTTTDIMEITRLFNSHIK